MVGYPKEERLDCVSSFSRQKARQKVGGTALCLVSSGDISICDTRESSR